MDANASPFHLALAEVAPSGNLVGYERISLHELLGAGKEERTNLSWQVAHQVVRLALEKGKAIAMEDLGKLPRGRRGDGLPKLRRRLQRWAYRAILEKVEILARRHGVEVVKADPAYTSVIGKLKYAPQYLVDKDGAGALVVGRAEELRTAPARRGIPALPPGHAGREREEATGRAQRGQRPSKAPHRPASWKVPSGERHREGLFSPEKGCNGGGLEAGGDAASSCSWCRGGCARAP